MASRRQKTWIPVTPTTHLLPEMNELDPNDETVVALTSHDDIEPLPLVDCGLGR